MGDELRKCSSGRTYEFHSQVYSGWVHFFEFLQKNWLYNQWPSRPVLTATRHVCKRKWGLCLFPHSIVLFSYSTSHFISSCPFSASCCFRDVSGIAITREWADVRVDFMKNISRLVLFYVVGKRRNEDRGREKKRKDIEASRTANSSHYKIVNLRVSIRITR